jgi:hypothetical protein
MFAEFDAVGARGAPAFEARAAITTRYGVTLARPPSS